MRDKRRHNRLVLPLPVRFQDAAAPAEEPGCLGTVKNISLGGLYFECPPLVNLKPGQILQLSIATSLPSLDNPDNSLLVVRGEVLRVDYLLSADRTYGVAIRFLEELNFSSP